METDQLISDEYGDEKIYVLGFEQTVGKKLEPASQNLHSLSSPSLHLPLKF